ncbi:MAG: NUDIX hydrolase [Chloroflexota bacterium]
MFTHSGVIPFIRQNSTVEFVVISNRSRMLWIFPKGMLEPDLTPAASALNEAYEEAGVTGHIIGDAIGTYQRSRSWGGIEYAEVFLMEVDTLLGDWPEAFFRERRVVDSGEALTLIAPYWKDVFSLGLKRIRQETN